MKPHTLSGVVLQKLHELIGTHLRDGFRLCKGAGVKPRFVQLPAFLDFILGLCLMAAVPSSTIAQTPG